MRFMSASEFLGKIGQEHSCGLIEVRHLFATDLTSQVDGGRHRRDEPHGARQLLRRLQERRGTGSEGFESHHDALAPALSLGSPLRFELASLHVFVLALLSVCVCV